MNELRDVFSPEVVAAFERFVDERVREQLSELTPVEHPALLDRAAAAIYLSISVSTLDRLRRQRRVRVEYVGRKPLYDRASLDECARSWRPA